MKQLEDFTLKQVSDYLINEIAEQREITKSQARKLFINAITYNVVVESILSGLYVPLVQIATSPKNKK